MRQSRTSSTEADHEVEPLEEGLLPYYESPFARDSETGSHHLRQSSNFIELFFDLFLAADLATFTEEHAVVDKNSLIAFIGFFTITWSTWFQITLHDVRFAHDSVYERICKFLQFLLFVAFALVGAEFKPLTVAIHARPEPNTVPDRQINLWMLSFTLCSSRLLLALQYLFVFFARHRPDRLKTPLLLHVFVLLLSASAFAGLTGLFTQDSSLSTRGSSLGYVTWYLLLVFEVIGILCITTVWKGLNFTYTHLAERMGLLTFIMIGEGAIGAANTTIDIMRDRALCTEPIFLIICIVLILVFLWTMYFKDLPSTPHGSFGQLAWSCLHLPLHLSFVGVLEATRQITIIRYIDQALSTFIEEASKICLQNHLDGSDLGDTILRLVDSYEYGMMHSSAEQSTSIREVIRFIAATPGICSVKNTAGITNLFTPSPNISFSAFRELLSTFANSLSVVDEPENIAISKGNDSFTIVQKSIRSVYLYYWSFALTMLLSFIILYWLNAKHNTLTTKCGLLSRCTIAVLAIVFLGLYSDSTVWTSFFASIAMLPTLCAMLALVVVMDRISTHMRLRAIGSNICTSSGAESVSWPTDNKDETKCGQ